MRASRRRLWVRQPYRRFFELNTYLTIINSYNISLQLKQINLPSEVFIENCTKIGIRESLYFSKVFLSITLIEHFKILG